MLVVALAWLTGCATPDTSEGNDKKLSDMFATPGWANISGPKATAQRAVTQNDLVSADGRCAGSPEPVPQATTEGAASNSAETPNEALSGQGALPALPGGVGLSMTECQVVQRTGSPDRIDISADGSERVTTMTVTHGSQPGLYRFRGGRLVSIERVDVPAPAKPAKAAKTKRASQTPPIRGSQQ